MINAIKFPKAYSEVYSFINALGEKYKEKIPSTIYKTIEENRDKEYNPIIKSNQEITKDLLSHEALALIAALNLQYWCENEEEKQELKKAYISNTKKEEERYSYENLFRNKKQQVIENKQEDKQVNSNAMMIEYKERIFRRIFKALRNFFKRE